MTQESAKESREGREGREEGKTKSKEISTQKKDAKNRKIRASYRGHKASTGAFLEKVCKATIALLVQAAKINNISFQPHFPFFLDSFTSQVNMVSTSHILLPPSLPPSLSPFLPFPIRPKRRTPFSTP